MCTGLDLVLLVLSLVLHGPAVFSVVFAVGAVGMAYLCVNSYRMLRAVQAGEDDEPH